MNNNQLRYFAKIAETISYNAEVAKPGVVKEFIYRKAFSTDQEISDFIWWFNDNKPKDIEVINNTNTRIKYIRAEKTKNSYPKMKQTSI